MRADADMWAMLRAVDALLGADGFRAAIVAGAILTLVACALRRRVSWLGWALIALIATVIGLRVEHRVAPAMIWALALLALAGALVGERRVLLQIAACVPGALLLAQVLPAAGPTWTRVVLVVAIALAAPIVLVCDRGLLHATPALLLGSVVGIWVCVPETGPVHSVVGALAPVAVVSLVVVLGAPSAPALWPLLGVVLWSAVAGGVPRPGAVVGGVACLGVLVLAPLMRWRSASRTDDAVLLVVQGLLVLFVARVAGFEESARAAAALCALGFAVAGAALALARFVPRPS